jgi:hypothetical protein
MNASHVTLPQAVMLLKKETATTLTRLGCGRVSSAAEKVVDCETGLEVKLKKSEKKRSSCKRTATEMLGVSLVALQHCSLMVPHGYRTSTQYSVPELFTISKFWSSTLKRS